MFKVSSIRPDQKYAMGHGPRGRVLCKCDECQANPEMGAWIDNPDKWGKRHEFARGHNARMDTARRSEQMRKNVYASQDKIDAARQTESYKEHMSESQKERWAIIKEDTPEKVQKIIQPMLDAKANTPMTDEWRKNIGDGKKKYIEENWEKFMEERKRAGDTKRGKPRSPETKEKMIRILQSPERREIVSKTHRGKPKSETMKAKQRAYWDDEDYRNTTKRKQAAGNGRHEPSEPELLFFDLFQMADLPLRYVGYDGFVIDGFVPDFVNEEKRVVVECYGDYHHNKPEIKERDARRAEAYANAGYSLVVLWAHEIQQLRGYENQREDEQAIVERIRRALDGSR